ncbi:MAG: flagellar assembly protein FliW [Methylococcales bacterium]|nr:flagellar assembly protein FliW [Methylococcales bacterium]
MKIKSKFLGEQQIDPETVLTFPKGIPGFETYQHYKLFHQQDGNGLYWLQSVDDEDVTFSLAEPSHFNINYTFILDNEESELLAADDPESLVIMLLLHTEGTSDTQQQLTIKGSIKAPIIINPFSKRGYQKMLQTIEQSITLTERRNEIALEETHSTQ